MFYTSLSTITTTTILFLLLLFFSLITISSTESIRCLSIPGSPRSNPIRSIPDCVRVLDAMSYDPRLRSNHGWASGGIPPGSFGMSILPVDWIYGTCRISLGQHEPSTPVRDAFALEKVFPDAARIMSYCMLGHGRDEGYTAVGPRQVVELHVATGMLEGSDGSVLLQSNDTLVVGTSISN